MGGFNGFTFGGSTSGASAVGVPLSSLIMPAYRIAGIIRRPMIEPNVDMYDEAIPELNRLLGSWNCDGHKIFTSSIDTFTLINGQKIYTIGLGGDFDMARPLFIKQANILFPTTPVVRRQLRLLDDAEWSAIAVQDLSGAPPYELYYDGGYDDSGLANIYLRFQPPDGYSLELYTWTALRADFAAKTDVAVFPPGYEHALVYNLAKSLAALNPEMANMQPAAYQIADRALLTLISLNTHSPAIETEPGLSREVGSDRGWLDGGMR